MRGSRQYKKIIALSCYRKGDSFFLYPMFFTYLSDLYEAIIRKLMDSFSESFPILIIMTIHVKLSEEEEEHVFNELMGWSYDYTSETLLEAFIEAEKIIKEYLGLKPTKIKQLGFQKSAKTRP